MIRKTILIAVLALSGLSVSASAQQARVSAGIRAGELSVRLAHDDFRAEFGLRKIGRARRAVARHDRHRTRRGRYHNRSRARSHRYGRGHARGYWKTVRQRVWVDGYYESVHVPAQWGYRVDECGRKIRYCVREAYYDKVWREGYWRYVSRRVWVSGHH